MLRVLKSMRKTFPLDIRELVIQSETIRKSHTSDTRVAVEELLAVYEIDEVITNPAPTAIAVLDDVLTVGRHYRAMHTVLTNRFPGVPIFGFFIARCAF